MKNFFYFIVSVLLCAILVGGIYVTTQDNTKPPDNMQSNSSVLEDGSNDKDSTDKGNSSTDDTDNGTGDSNEPDKGNTEEDNSLKNPTNAEVYIADGLEMVSGASIYLGEEEYEPAMRFTCKVSGAMKTAVDNDSNKELAFLVAPVEFFDAVNPNKYTYIDWVTAFNESGKAVIYSPLEESSFNANGDDYIVRFRLQNILYKNMNRRFVCMLVLKTTNGNATTYKYSEYVTGVNYRNNARSVAYVAAAALNAHALGMETFTEDKLARLKGYINQSVDLANGKTEATDDGSMYAFATNVTAPQSLAVGEVFAVTTTISPKVEIPVWYRSSDESIIQVESDGRVRAIGKGTAVVGVYVAGESCGITVTVS